MLKVGTAGSQRGWNPGIELLRDPGSDPAGALELTVNEQRVEAVDTAVNALLRPSGLTWLNSPHRSGIEDPGCGVALVRVRLNDVSPLPGCSLLARVGTYFHGGALGSHGRPARGRCPVRHGYILSQEGWSEAAHLSMIGAEGVVPATSWGKEPSQQ